MEKREAPIGVFDSGLGGISVLKELLLSLPGERYCFFGDRANAPYGSRDPEEVVALTQNALTYFQSLGCKAMVIACNTATAAAADLLRKQNPGFPIVAIEPALKPAVTENPGKNILLMATPLAVKTARIRNLKARFEDRARITLLPCPGLVELIEGGHLQDETIKSYLKTLFSTLENPPQAVVLGCTHYPHIAPALKEYFGQGVTLYDGGAGTARQMRAILEEKGLLNEGKEGGEVSFRFSAGGEEIQRLARALLGEQFKEESK